ncbi:MAG: FAD-binding protein [Bacteroidota bacterium]|nr:FAD-binding protein [Bacteroidota bacterium]
MKRKTFLKLSSTLIAAPLFSPIEGWAQQEKLKNWAGNLEYSTGNVYYPKSVAEVQKLVKRCSKLRALGTRHCFNTIADSKDNLISTKEMNKVVALDANARTVTVEGGIKYGELSPWLHKKGFALHNLASLPHISVAGSCTTATHGSGVKNGNLATPVNALEIVTANSNVIHLSREKDGEKFLAAVVGLGALGVITKVALDIQPTFMMRQNVYLNLPMSQLKEHFEKIVSAGYSVSLFTDWQSESINEVWIKSREDDATNNNAMPEFFGAKAATKNIHPIAELSAENCTEQMGVPGPWYERLPHFKMGFTPSSGKELQAEYFIPIHNAVDAILAIQRLGKQIGPYLFISEIRTIAADNLWMSPCRKQASATIHFTWKQDWRAVSKLLPLIEKELEPFKAKPHWGKLFTMSPKVLASRYEKLHDFKNMIAMYDPQEKFRNDFLNRTIYANV